MNSQLLKAIAQGRAKHQELGAVSMHIYKVKKGLCCVLGALIIRGSKPVFGGKLKRKIMAVDSPEIVSKPL